MIRKSRQRIDRVDKRAAEESYEQAKQLAASSPVPTPTPSLDLNRVPPLEMDTVFVPTPEPIEPLDPAMEYLLTLDLDSLRRVNGEVEGWIVVPDTVLDYPLMQSANNYTYLSFSWDLQRSNRGAIFFDSQMKTDFSYFNTIIYGHNMQGGSMFNTIRKMEDQSFFEQHPIVYIVTDDLVRRFEVFSGFEADVTGPAYWLGELKEEHKQALLDYSLAENTLKTDLVRMWRTP